MKKILFAAIMLCISIQNVWALEIDQIQEDSLAITLGEVTVKGTLPKTRVKGDAMRTIINGSVLEKTTSATEMLKYVPNVNAESGSVSVIGRGASEVYINGRKVQDLKELDEIRPELIQHVDVVTNPGARYSASTRSVIRITMKRPQGEGFGFTSTTYGSYQFGWTGQEQLDINYRKKGLDLSGSVLGMTYGFGQDQLLTFRSLAGDKVLSQVGKDDTEGRANYLNPKVQFNYMVSDKHSFGAWYMYGNNFYQHATAHLDTRITLGEEPQEHTISNIFHDWKLKSHNASMYYNGQVGQWTIDFNADGVWANNRMPLETTEETQFAGTNSTLVVRNDNNDQIDLYAAKLVVSRPLWKGNLSFGSEYSYSRHAYQTHCDQPSIVPDAETDNHVNENIIAGFAEYALQLGKLGANLGLRYEHAQNDYFEGSILSAEQSRKYDDFFPSVSLSYPVGLVQMSLSYAQDITRPDYTSLNNNLMYVNRYTFQCGNPMLRPTYAHDIVYNASYKWVTLMATFSRVEDEVSLVAEHYPADPSKTLLRSQNIDAYNKGNIALTLSPVIAQIWRPQFTLSGSFQSYHAQTLDGSTQNLNRPVLSFQWENFITLPKGFILMPSVGYCSKGDQANTRINDNIYYTALSVRKSFMRNKLLVTLNASNPFEWADTNATLYGAREMRTDLHKPRSFYAHVVYRFNTANNKYKGTGAGEAQKARMKN